ncbi:MAG: M67 family metallopeptidase [Nitrospirota bacterium]
MLTITKSDLARILDHCLAGYPNEACGILGGRDGMVEKVYRMTNARPGPTTYEMDPEEQFRVMKDIREADLAMVGMYHSHPGGHAYPSSVDVERAYWPGTRLPNYPSAVYVIVSLLDRANPAVRGYRIDEGTVSEISLAVTEQLDDPTTTH